MHSPLHERLEYLVNYSSQLIFVSGDSIAQQQKNLEAFVFNQHDETEIAYLTATSNLELSDYRRQLCQQLLGQQVGSYIKPLNELLAGLKSHDGPVLVTITASENIPDAFLQELWDLVLQSRFADNQQHLNVLLFGQSEWAEAAKQWLPANNSDTPLLISSHSVVAEQVKSDLDQLIDSRRKAFERHLSERQQIQSSDTTNRLKSPRFWTTAVILFLLCFTGLVAWQYGSNINDLFDPINSSTDSSSLVSPGSAYQQLTQPQSNSPDSGNQVEIISANSGSVNGALTNNTSDNDTAEINTRSDDSTVRLTPVNTKPGQNNNQTADANEPVATWTQQVATWDENTGHEPLTTRTQATGSHNTRQPSEIANQQASTSKPGYNSEALDTLASTELPASGARVNVSLNPQWVRQAQNLVKQLDQMPGKSSTAPVTPDNARLQKLLTPNDYVLQLAGLKDETLLRDFVNEHNLNDKVWIYQTQRYGSNWFVLLFQQPFASVDEARRAIELLPNYPRKEQAFVKSATQVLEEISISSL